MNITKICLHCKTEKSYLDFNKKRNANKSLSSYCKKCTVLQATQRQQKLKQQAVEYKGSKCLCCGYNTYNGALEFHHLNPETKEFNISQAKHLNFNAIKEELDKCILLCSNCHKEIHAGLIEYNMDTAQIKKAVKLQEKWNPSAPVKSTLDISVVLNRFKNGEKTKDIAKDLNITSSYLVALLTKEGIYISDMPEQQDILHPKKIEWPSVEDMQRLVWEKSTVMLSKELGVSDVAIAKYCKKHNISKPTRGYWAKLYAEEIEKNTSSTYTS